MDFKAPSPQDTTQVAAPAQPTTKPDTPPPTQSTTPPQAMPVSTVAYKGLMWTAYVFAALVFLVGIALGVAQNNPGYYIGLTVPAVALAGLSGYLVSKSNRWSILTMALASIASFTVMPLAAIIGIAVTIILAVKVKGK